jgi:spermidine synthase
MEKDVQQDTGRKVADDQLIDTLDMWYRELNNKSAGLTLRVDEILESTRSEFQDIAVIRNRVFGKLLVLYGSLMVADNDQNAYNEMIAHVPLFSHPAPKKVLVIGGGDCGAVTEVARHPEVESATMCEIDETVVEVAKVHFPYLTEGLKDPRVHLIFEDGKLFIENTTEKFDVIILDLSDPVGPAYELFQKEFHRRVFACLNDDGILVAQAESPYFNREATRSMFANLSDIFPLCRLYTCFMPIYPSGLWAFAYCSKTYDPLADFDEARWDTLNLPTRYYNAETHRGAFALPQFIRNLTKPGQ